MKQIITILILIGVFYVGKQIYLQWDAVKQKERRDQGVEIAPAAPSPALPGMPPTFEASLQAAQSQGAIALKNWLTRYRPFIRDPRLGDIELDYVVLVSRQDTAEAKQVFREVKDRTPTDSPLYARIKRLEKNYL